MRLIPKVEGPAQLPRQLSRRGHAEARYQISATDARDVWASLAGIAVQKPGICRYDLTTAHRTIIPALI
jgi:hypothetical protein